MTKHLTVRIAGHDNRWNGEMCLNPEGNRYCTGAFTVIRMYRKKPKC